MQVAINLMVNQLLGVSSESQVNEMAQLFSDFVDGCLSIPINIPGSSYHTAMKVPRVNYMRSLLFSHDQHFSPSNLRNRNLLMYLVYNIHQIHQICNELKKDRREYFVNLRD
jgi:hypothetical protein